MVVDLDVEVVVDGLSRINIGSSGTRRSIAGNPNASVHDQDHVYVHVHEVRDRN